MEYKIIKAEEYCNSVRDGTHDTPKKTKDGYKLITSKHIKDNCIDFDSAYCISKEDFDKVNERSLVEKNDILYSMIGTIGLIHRVKEEPNYAIKNIGLFKIRDELKSKWLYYYLKSPTMMQYINSLLTGSTQQYVTLKNLRNLPIKVLDNIDDTRKVVKILECVDKKIELNNQINDNLHEVIKQYINENYYKSDVKQDKINTIGKIQGGYAFKSNDLLDQKTNNKIFKIKNITGVGIDIDNTQYVVDEIANKVDLKFRLNPGDVIVAMTGAELGKTGYLYGRTYKYFLNQRVGVVRGISKEKNLYLNCVFLLEQFQTLLNSKGYGSAQPNISTSDIENIEIPIPDEEELANFYSFAKPIYDRMILNSEEILKLQQLRDTLLPKLMNGEIDLDKVEI